ncbi:MAG: cysteine dioxygenase family protein [Bacteroidota bacterium]
MKTLDELFSALDTALRSGKKLKDLGPVLAGYSGDDWKQYEIYKADHYARNLVKMNDQLELLVLCWEVKQGCPVHDHPVNGCLVRVMQSEVTENVYKLSVKPEFISSSILPTDGIAYKEGNEILHEIFNHSDKRAASIHIYSPSNYRPNYFV